MSGRTSRETREQAKRLRRYETLMALLTILLAAGAWWGFSSWRGNIGQAQPIPFSHRVHAGSKKIGCLFCHSSATRAMHAGVPPLETCMLCHERIAIGYPPIEDLRRRYERKEPVMWERVNVLSEFVYFPHLVHLNRGIDCGACHGNIREMDRVVPAHEFRMGFCIDCHERNGATRDCFTCHR